MAWNRFKERRKWVDRRESIKGYGGTQPSDAQQAEYQRSLSKFDSLPQEAREMIAKYGDPAISAVNLGHKNKQAILIFLKSGHHFIEPEDLEWIEDDD